MSAVDVLAVIGILASIVRTDNGNKYPEINTLLDDAEKARAAVAELIESSQALLDEWNRQDAGRFDGMTAKAFFAAEARFRAALARATGAQS